jgi:hypothetical protein
LYNFFKRERHRQQPVETAAINAGVRSLRVARSLRIWQRHRVNRLAN